MVDNALPLNIYCTCTLLEKMLHKKISNCWVYLCYRYTVDDARLTLSPCLISTTWPLYACVTTASCSRSHPLLSTNEKTPYRWNRNVFCQVIVSCHMFRCVSCFVFDFDFFFFFSFCWKVLLKCKQSLCVYYWFLLWSLINYQEHLMLWKWKNNQWIWTKDPCNQLIRFFFVRCNVAMVWDVIVLYCKLIVNIVSPATFCMTFSCNEKGTR